MGYAIETIDLVKRYSTSARSGRGRHGGPGPWGVTSLSSLFSIIKRPSGPFVEALRGINLKVDEGQTFGILGPNGAGKTTLIKILCTLIIQDGGEAYVHGIDVKKEPLEVLKNLQAVLPESRGFTWRLTGRQNLEFYAILYGLSEAEAQERIDYLLDLTGLADRANDGYQQYSTGMQRKLLLCRALLRSTPILLFDEPTVGLDPASAAEFRNLLHDKLAGEEKKTILLSTHNLYEAQSMCDRIAILDRGRITANDTPDNIRYMMFDEKVFEVTFVDATFTDEHEKMINELEEIPGVHGATPEVDEEANLKGISIRVNKNMDISDVLSVIMKRKLKIRSVNTQEPSLEDAFMAITSRHEEQRAWGS